MKHIAIFLTGSMLVACGSESSDKDPEGESTTALKIATWYSAPGEPESMQEVINDYLSDQSGKLVELVSVPIEAQGRLEAYQGGVDWDVGLQMAPFMTQTAGLALDLNEVAAFSDMQSRVNPLLKDVIEPPAADKLVGAPLSIIRLAGLLYTLENLPDYASSDIYPPKNFQDYYDLCDGYLSAVADAGDAAGIPAPWATSKTGIVPRQYLIDLVALLPPEVVFATAQDPVTPLMEVLDLMAYYRDNGCFVWIGDENGDGVSWDNMVQAIIDGEALMQPQPTWGAGYMSNQGKSAGQDFAFSFATENSAYSYTVENIVVNASTVMQEEAVAFVKTAMSKETQLAFSARRGSVPAVVIDDPAEIADRGTRDNYMEFQEAGESGRRGPMSQWIASGPKPGQFLDPFMAGDMERDEVIYGYLCTAMEGVDIVYPNFDCSQLEQ